MKSSRAPRLFHTVPPTSESPAHFSSVPTLMDSKHLAKVENPVLTGDGNEGIIQNSEMDAAGTRVVDTGSERTTVQDIAMNAESGSLKSAVPCDLMDPVLEPPDDVIVLYHTLVQDGALPPGFESSFADLGRFIFPAADRQVRNLARLGNVEAAVMLHRHSKQRTQMDQLEKRAEDQFLAAALNKPKIYKTRLQKSFYQTATARKDMEEAERVRWVSELCTLLRGTATPMGKLLLEKPGTESLVGAGKRAATLRSRVRMARKYLAWLSMTYRVSFPTCVEHLTEYLKVRVSEPCNRGALRNTHRGFGFLDETAGVTAEASPSRDPLYSVIFNELLSKVLQENRLSKLLA